MSKALEAAARVSVLREYVSDVVWSAYHSGIVQNGEWWTGCMSDAEWLQRILKLPKPKHCDGDVRAKLEGAIDTLCTESARDILRAFAGNIDDENTRAAILAGIEPRLTPPKDSRP
jgi:hypothetical protein